HSTDAPSESAVLPDGVEPGERQRRDLEGEARLRPAAERVHERGADRPRMGDDDDIAAGTGCAEPNHRRADAFDHIRKALPAGRAARCGGAPPRGAVPRGDILPTCAFPVSEILLQEAFVLTNRFIPGQSAGGVAGPA